MFEVMNTSEYSSEKCVSSSTDGRGAASTREEMGWAHRAEMIALDRLGFDVEVWDESGERVEPLRLGFEKEVTNPGQVRAALVKLAKEARVVLGKEEEG